MSSAAARLLRENAPLFAMAYRFNCQPALDLHPDHLEGALEGVVDRGLYNHLARSPRGERRLSEFVARRFELDPRGCWELSDPANRLAALDHPRFERLVTMTGVAVLCRPISRVIAREPLRRIKESLGEAVYTFAVKRAPFLIGRAGEDSPPPADDDPRRWVDAAGLRRLAACWADAPAPLVERLRLKLPPQAELPATTNTPREPTLRLALKILLQEIDPDLAPCFN